MACGRGRSRLEGWCTGVLPFVGRVVWIGQYTLVVLTKSSGQDSVPAHDCGVEQLAARRAHNPEVAGSSPVPAIRT